ncbi:MAG: serine/threonine protein kinase [Planctomycetota bacterium]|nr:MAG: serine/threonine protein kinase [Planctomycetota bacterium]
MNIHEVNAETVDRHIPDLAPTAFIGAGGQKRVFKCEYHGETWALPLIVVSDNPDVTLDGADSEFGLNSDQVIARLRREVEIMRKCDSPHLVKMGPMDVTPVKIENLSILYFLEEYIDGDDLKHIMTQDRMPIDQIKDVGVHVTRAIDALWNCDPSQQIIHRDLKPANVMRRASTGEFVVLDVGLAFDLLDESISHPGQVPGTTLYFTPDQLDHTRKRQMDFRTDMFALGVILYEATTGKHPFYSTSMSTMDLFKSILHAKPKPVRDLRPDAPNELEVIIMRLLAKKPHLRYRTCESLLDAFDRVDSRGDT